MVCVLKESEWQIFAVSLDRRHEGEGSEERGRAGGRRAGGKL